MSWTSLPQGWERIPLKRVAHINERELNEQTDPNYAFRYLDIATVGRGCLVDEPRVMSFSQAPSRARRLVRRGDTLVSTVRTYLRAIWTVDQQAGDLVASTGFAVVSPTKDVDSRFLSWWLQSDDFIERVVAKSVGVSYPAINPFEIGRLEVPIPPRPIQRRIADFLDNETARIDQLVGSMPISASSAYKRGALGRLVVLLQERRQALITAAVTGQLDISSAA